MLKEFTADFERNEVWKFGIALDLSAAGTGAALVLFSLITGMRTGILVGLAMGCVGEAALFLDLGHRTRFWRAFAKGARTWISLGTLGNTGLLVFGVLFLLVPEEGGILSTAFKIMALLCSMIVMIYGSSLLSSMAAIPFWRSSLLPVLFLAHSAASAIAMILAILALTGRSIGSYSNEISVAMALFLFTLLFTWLYTGRFASRSGAVQESVHLLTKGPLKPLFFGGAYTIGLLVPFLLTIVYYLVYPNIGIATTALMVSVMVLRFIGDVSFRYSVLGAGVYEPVV